MGKHSKNVSSGGSLKPVTIISRFGPLFRRQPSTIPDEKPTHQEVVRGIIQESVDSFVEGHDEVTAVYVGHSPSSAGEGVVYVLVDMLRPLLETALSGLAQKIHDEMYATAGMLPRRYGRIGVVQYAVSPRNVEMNPSLRKYMGKRIYLRSRS